MKNEFEIMEGYSKTKSRLECHHWNLRRETKKRISHKWLILLRYVGDPNGVRTRVAGVRGQFWAHFTWFTSVYVRLTPSMWFKSRQSQSQHIRWHLYILDIFKDYQWIVAMRTTHQYILTINCRRSRYMPSMSIGLIYEHAGWILWAGSLW